jgi:hypothetical protein
MGIVTINGGDFPRDSRSIINDNFNFLDSATFKLDQTNRQTVTGGVPIFNNGLEANGDTWIGPTDNRFCFSGEIINLELFEPGEFAISPIPTGNVPTYSPECTSDYAQYKGRSVFGLMDGNPSGHIFSPSTSVIDAGFLMCYVNNNNYDSFPGGSVISADQFANHKRTGIISGYAPNTTEINIAHFFSTKNEATYIEQAANSFSVWNAGVYGGINLLTKNDTNEVVFFTNFGMLSEVICDNREIAGTSHMLNALYVGNIATYSIPDSLYNEANGDVYNVFMLANEYESKNTDYNYAFVDTSSKNTTLLGLSHTTKLQDSKLYIHSSVADQDIARFSRSSTNSDEGDVILIINKDNLVGIGTATPSENLTVVGSASFHNTIDFTYGEVTDVFESEVKYGTVNTVDFMGMEAPFASGLYVKVSGEPTTIPPIGVMSNNYIGFTSFNQEYYGGVGALLFGGAESTGLQISADSYGIDMTVGLSSDFGESARTNPIMINTYLYPNQGGIGFSLYIEDDYSEYSNYDVYGIKLYGNTKGWGIFLEEFSTGIEIDLSAGAYGLKVDNGSATDYAIYSTTGRNYFGNDIELINSAYFYLGDQSSDGSWRIGQDSGNLIFQKRESGSWVTKSTIPS